jgi:hypothetical protein
MVSGRELEAWFSGTQELIGSVFGKTSRELERYREVWNSKGKLIDDLIKRGDPKWYFNYWIELFHLLIGLLQEFEVKVAQGPVNEDAVVKEVLANCYRRALFTRMHAQIDINAMFSSIDRCRQCLQRNIPNIRGETLQTTAIELLAAVEQIQRRENPSQSWDDTRAINKLKLTALHLFRKLAATTDGRYPLPEPGNLAEAVYFTQQEADAPLSVDDLRGQTMVDPTPEE